MSTNKNNALAELSGLQLSSVEFVQNYFQLRFDGPCLTVYNPAVVETGNANVRSGENHFRNAICEQIGKMVERIELSVESLVIMMEDESRIVVSLKDQDYQGPEAINFHGIKTKYRVVI